MAPTEQNCLYKLLIISATAYLSSVFLLDLFGDLSTLLALFVIEVRAKSSQEVADNFDSYC